jgi:arginine/ornithine transport system permease protein
LTSSHRFQRFYRISTEIIRDAIEATARVKIESANAAGMSRMLMLRRIILPSGFRGAHV